MKRRETPYQNMITKEQLAKKELALYEYSGEDRMIPSHELAEALEKDSKRVVSFPTGFQTLDRLLNNVEEGELIVVTAPTGHGKTTLLMDITSRMSQKDILSAWFSLEVTPRQFIEKITAGGKKLPLFFVPASVTDSNIQWLLNRIVEAKVKYDIKVVFIDHLHQLFSVDKFNGKNLSLELGDIVAKIKSLAIELGLVVFLVAHSTDDKTHTTREPKMMDIRDSGMISRLADVVIGIWRVQNGSKIDDKVMNELREADTWAKVRIWKNRREGKHGTFFLDHSNHSYIEIDPYRSEESLKDWENFSR